MQRCLAIYGPIACFQSHEPSGGHECQGEKAKNGVDNLVPTPIMFPVATRVYLKKANDDPNHPHEYTMNFVYEIFVVSLIGELAGTDGRE